jgi:hypothetical protein
MNFVTLPFQLQREGNDESPNHPHRSQVRVVVDSCLSDQIVMNKVDTVQLTSSKALNAGERRNQKENLRDGADGQVNELMDAGILLGETYDAKFNEELLIQPEES